MSSTEKKYTLADIKAVFNEFKNAKFELPLSPQNAFSFEAQTPSGRQVSRTLQYNYLGEILNDRTKGKVVVVWGSINATVLRILQLQFNTALANHFVQYIFDLEPDHGFKTYEDFRQYVDANAEEICVSALKKRRSLNFKQFLQSKFQNGYLSLKDSCQTVEVSYNVRVSFAFALQHEAEGLKPSFLFNRLLAGASKEEILSEIHAELNSGIPDSQRRLIGYLPEIIANPANKKILGDAAVEAYTDNIKQKLPNANRFLFASTDNQQPIHVELLSSTPLHESKEFNDYCEAFTEFAKSITPEVETAESVK